MTNNGGPAFPAPVCNAPLTSGGSVGVYPQITQSGMSLRDYFASVALEHTRAQADKAGSADIERLFPGTGQVTREQIAARLAYKMADAMLGGAIKMTKRDRIQTTGIVILAVLGAALVVLVRAAQIAHVQFFD